MILLFARALAADDPCVAAPEVLAERSAAVKKLYDDSEAERADRGTPSVQKRDEQRINELRKADKRGELCTADDKWYAAWVMQQADSLDTLERAYELAIETMQAFHKNGPWLVAFAFDRKRTAAGLPQAFGTQTRVDDQHRRCLVEIDGSVTDDERAKHGQKPLAEVYRKVLDLNGYTDDEATLDRVQRRGLYCEPQAVTFSGRKLAREL